MRSLFLIAAAMAWLAGPAGSAVRWGGAASPNMAGAARNLLPDPGAVKPLWELRIGMHQYSIPTVDGDRIFLGTNDAAVDRPGYKPSGGGAVTCVDRASGKIIWRLPSPRFFPGVTPPYHFDQWRCGICSGPVVEGNRVYVIGSRGEILCLDREGQANGNDGPFRDELKYMDLATTAGTALAPTDGDIIWKYDLIPQLDVVLHDVCGSTLLLDGDLLYACTSNGIDNIHNQVPRPLAPTLIALDKRTGRLVARDGEKIGQRLFHCNWSSPCAGEAGGRRLIFFGAGDGILYAFEPPPPAAPGAPVRILKKVWSYDCNPPEYRMRDGKPIPHSTDRKRTPDGPSEIIGTAVFVGGRVYVAIGQSPLYGEGQGCLSCVDAATGQRIWESRRVGRTLATPAVAGGLVYIPDLAGVLHCLDAATGEPYWDHPLEGKTWYASAFVADGKVYAGTENNLLWVLKAGKEKQVLSRTHLSAAPITIVAADGVLYIPTQQRLIAVPGPDL